MIWVGTDGSQQALTQVSIECRLVAEWSGLVGGIFNLLTDTMLVTIHDELWCDGHAPWILQALAQVCVQ